MNDLVKRLRSLVRPYAAAYNPTNDEKTIMEAADRIEALERALDVVPAPIGPETVEWAERTFMQSRIEELEAALRSLINYDNGTGWKIEECEECGIARTEEWKRARRALEHKP